MPEYYYIVKNLPADPVDLPDGPRITVVNLPEGFLMEHLFESGEGPFLTIKELKNQSKIFKTLLKENPKRAIRIFEEKYLVKGKIIFYPTGRYPEYEQHLYKIMQHSNTGRVVRRDVFGVHLYNPEKVRVINITKPKNNVGVWEAEVEVLNNHTDLWVRKQTLSTFFPEGWDLQRLIIECERAFMTRVRLEENIYGGFTYSGVPVAFVFQNGELKTVYPLYDTRPPE